MVKPLRYITNCEYLCMNLAPLIPELIMVRIIHSRNINDGHHIQREFINPRCTEIENFKELEIGDWYGLCLNLGVNNAAKMNELKYSYERTGEKKRERLQVYFDTGEAYWEEVVGAIIKHPVSK